MFKRLKQKNSISETKQETTSSETPSESDQTKPDTSKKAKKKRPVKPPEINSLTEADQALSQCSQIDSFLEAHSSEAPDAKLNTTDPDSKMMKSDDNIKQRYNAQVISNGQIIVSANLTNEENDQHQLKTMVDQLKRNIASDATDKEASRDTQDENQEESEDTITDNPDKSQELHFAADAGYNAGENLKYLDEQEDIDAYISMYRRDQSELSEEEKQFLKENFEYNEDADEWVCPEGKSLENYGEKIEGNKKMTAYHARRQDCQGCSLFKKCVQTKEDLKRGHRTIIDNGYLIYRKEMKDKMSQKESKEIYRKRSGEVEGIFGQMKYNQRIQGFYYRGLRKFKSEFLTLCLAHNLGKMMRYELKTATLTS